ncbi:MAG: LmeA family phospholipid-binding protein [Candidatus Woesearchaeota archaeon]
MKRILLVVVGLVVTLLLAAQLLLPTVAAQQIRDHLSRSGTVLHVEVDAFPAIELLWHQADRVVVRMGSYRSSAARLSSTLSQVADTGTMDASAARMTAGLLTLRNARLRKQGNELTGSATITESDLRASIPILDGVQPVVSADGALTLRGTATVFGLTATADATVQPQNGDLIVTPDLPLGGLATITLFSNPRIAVEGVAASPVPGGFALTAHGRLR